jgi:tRNA dimethylallyltransferase
MSNPKQEIIIICGPTASGKTNLALQLAKDLHKANILSADSRQVYKNLGIITGKDIPQNLSPKITFFGHDIFNSDERANLADFVRYARNIIQISKKSNTPLIIVGGTGLYLKALSQNLSQIETPPNPKLRQKLEKLSLTELQNRLQKENPRKLSSLNRSDFMNPRRLIRAIEISTSKIKSPKNQTPQNQTSFHWVGLSPDKYTLKISIQKRVQERLKAGAIDEVKNLLKKFPDRTLTIYSSLGVSQIIDYLDKKISKRSLIDLWTNAEVDYARRQTVWFKKQPGIVWYDKDIDKQNLSKDLSKIYQKNAKKTTSHY